MPAAEPMLAATPWYCHPWRGGECPPVGNSPACRATIFKLVDLADACGPRAGNRLSAGRRRRGEGLTMTKGTTSWLDRLRSMSRSHLATQASILLPVVVAAGLAAWTMLSAPTSARGQGANQALLTPDAQTSSSQTPNAEPGAEPAPTGQAALVEPAVLSGLKISSQSWRRGGLG